MIGKVWPEPASTAAGRRTCDLIAEFQGAGWSVEFASPAERGPHGADLGPLGVRGHAVRPNDPAFDALLLELRPSVVVFDRFMIEEQFGWRVERSLPEALRVLDTSDLHCLREARGTALKTGREPEAHNETALREIASILRSDLSLLISEYELGYVGRHFPVPDESLMYWPFSVHPPTAQRGQPGFEERAHFAMIGNFLHPPNLDAVRWCRREVWPRLRALAPGAELHCYGAYGEKYAGELDDRKSGFHFCGRAEEAVATLRRYRVNLTPLRFGAGLKGKLFDGYAAGTPGLSTPVGVEGIAPEAADWGCPVVDDAAELAAAGAVLHADAEAWETARRGQAELFEARFAAERWRGVLAEAIERAFRERAVRRGRDFLGRMLRHHHHRSTEYMSRWIEAKNKKG